MLCGKKSYPCNDMFVVMAFCTQEYSHMLFSHDCPSQCINIMFVEKATLLCVSIVKTLHNAGINMLPVANLLTLLFINK